jgi:hypothetical protein
MINQIKSPFKVAALSVSTATATRGDVDVMQPIQT